VKTKAYILRRESLNPQCFQKFGIVSVGRTANVENASEIFPTFLFNPSDAISQIEQALSPLNLSNGTTGGTTSIPWKETAAEEYAAALPTICGRVDNLGCIDVIAEILERLAVVPLGVGRRLMLDSI
jgi:hypothetical protein